MLLTLGATVSGQVYPNARTGGNYMQNFYFPPAGSSTPWWPSWSPDGEWIAFAMDGSIWKIQPGDSAAYEIASIAPLDRLELVSPVVCCSAG